MESYGELLKGAREERHLDIEIVARETSISRQWLEAMELEEPYQFPGEPYFIGFLKSYSDYLGLDKERIVALYQAKKIQEALPPAALTARERPKFVIPLIIVVILLLLAAGAFALWKYMPHPEENDPLALLEKPVVSKQYELNEKPFSARVFKNDKFVLGTEKGNIILTVAQTTDIFGLETPAGIQFVELSEQVEMDADGDSIPEIIVFVKDVSSKSNDRGAVVDIMLKSSKNVAISSPDESLILKAEEVSANQPMKEILSDTRAYPFTIQAKFRAGCLFRYRADRKETIEDYLENGEVLNVTASNAFRLWMSNGNTVKIQIIANGRTYDVDVTKAGEVIVQDIKWIKDTNGKYRLVIIDLD